MHLCPDEINLVVAYMPVVKDALIHAYATTKHECRCVYVCICSRLNDRLPTQVTQKRSSYVSPTEDRGTPHFPT